VQPIKRKRVTRVGSGAYSIYLPKRWIDAWTPSQQKDREVDLHVIGDGLLVLPVLRDRAHRSKVEADKGALTTRLLSAYVRGAVEARVEPLHGEFDGACITTARDFLRHLDERLVSTVGPEAIGFTLPDGVAVADPDALRRAMAAKMREILQLCIECVGSFGTEPDRALHAARLIRSLQAEDLSRLFHQTLRRVATLEVPIETISELQLLDLVAAQFHAMGTQAVQAAAIILEGYGLTLEDLDYPRPDLLRRVGRRDALAPLARDMVQGHKRALEDLLATFDEFMAALDAGDLRKLSALAKTVRADRTEAGKRMFSAVVRHWGDPRAKGAASSAFTAYQLSQPISNLHGGLVRIATHTVTLLAARGEAK
jgi:hypothetical protein